MIPIVIPILIGCVCKRLAVLMRISVDMQVGRLVSYH